MHGVAAEFSGSFRVKFVAFGSNWWKAFGISFIVMYMEGGIEATACAYSADTIRYEPCL